MKKNVFLIISFFCFSKLVAYIPGSIDELKKSLQPILLQQYDATKYLWAYSSFEDIYTKNRLLYRDSSYIASQENFLLLFENINKKMIDTKEAMSIRYNKDQKIVIVGSLYGGAECLMDYIEHWEQSGIINKDLIVQKNYSIIFLGNAVSKSPYSQETLAIIGLLIYKNQNNVIFMQGELEYQETWVDHALGNQMADVYAVSGFSMVKNMINTFFARCPRSVHISFDDKDTHKILCIPSSYQILSPESLDADIVISGISSNDFIIRERNNGLFLMPPIRGITNWKVFSAYTPMMKEYYNFSTYSYVVLAKNMITHVSRIEGQQKYQQQVYDVYTGLLNIGQKK